MGAYFVIEDLARPFVLETMPRYSDLPPEANEFFPANGWIVGATGVRLLRLPIIRLYQIGEPTHRYFIDNRIGGVWLQERSPYRTLRQLAVCLRDLHREHRELLPLVEPHGRTDPTRYREAMERCEVLLIAAFILLRRLADELVDASRPFLFEHWHSAPQKMKSAVPWARDNRLRELNPICDLDVLTEALLNHTAWFDRLRNVDGIRDILTHKPHILQVGAQGSRRPDEASTNWRVTAHLTQMEKGGNLKTTDLFPALLECIDHACVFMQHLCASVKLGGGYRQGDYLMLTGSDNDIVGCWPQVGGSREEFPLMA